jgi:hypothetical protein
MYIKVLLDLTPGITNALDWTYALGIVLLYYNCHLLFIYYYYYYLCALGCVLVPGRAYDVTGGLAYGAFGLGDVFSFFPGPSVQQPTC